MENERHIRQEEPSNWELGQSVSGGHAREIDLPTAAAVLRRTLRAALDGVPEALLDEVHGTLVPYLADYAGFEQDPRVVTNLARATITPIHVPIAIHSLATTDAASHYRARALDERIRALLDH